MLVKQMCDISRFVSNFGTWFFGEIALCKNGDRGGRSDGCGGGCGGGSTQVGNVVGGGGGVSVVEVDNAVRMSVGDGDAGNRRNGVVNGEGDVGMGVGGAKQRDCCRFPKIFVKLWEDSWYSLPF